VLSCDSTVFGTTRNDGLSQVFGPNNSGEHFYRVRADVPPGQRMTITVDTCNAESSYDTALFLWADCPSTTQRTVVASNDDTNCGFHLKSRIRYTIDHGETYYVQIEGYRSSTGAYALSMACAVETIGARRLLAVYGAQVDEWYGTVSSMLKTLPGGNRLQNGFAEHAPALARHINKLFGLAFCVVLLGVVILVRSLAHAKPSAVGDSGIHALPPSGKRKARISAPVEPQSMDGPGHAAARVLSGAATGSACRHLVGPQTGGSQGDPKGGRPFS